MTRSRRSSSCCAPRPATTSRSTSRAPSSAASSAAWPFTRSNSWTSTCATCRDKPAEVEALFRDLLIGVTSFFRDPEAFEALEKQVMPAALRRQAAGAPIRVWVPGCSTGEEAYSIAILLQEQVEALQDELQAAGVRHRHRQHGHRPRSPRHLPRQHRRRRLAGAAGALLRRRARGRHYRIHKTHPRSGGVLRAGRDQGSAVLQARPDQLPQPADLHGSGAAEEAHPAVPLRA